MRIGRGESAPARAAARRMAAMTHQWSPTPAPPDDDHPPDPDRPSGLDALRPSVTPEDPWQRVHPRVRVGPWSRPAIRAFLLLVFACLVLAAWWWWSGRPYELVPMAEPTVVASGTPMTGLPPSAPVASPSPRATSEPAAVVVAPVVAETSTPVEEVVVHVSGDVVQPGLVRLPPGARVADAVAAAGGVTRRRAADSVNLARLVVDGEQIVVDADVPAASRPATGPPAAPDTTATAPSGATGSGPGSALDGSVGAPMIVDLNVADAAVLETLPGVGPVLAGRIVQWRAENGPFRSVDELGEVAGIGDAILARLRPVVRL